MGETITGGVLALLGLMVGMFSNVARDRLAWRRDHALAAAAEAAELFDLVWAGEQSTYRPFDTHVRKLKVHLELLGLSGKSVEELEAAARACRRESADNAEQGVVDDDGSILAWVEPATMDRLEAAIQQVNVELRGRRWLPGRRL